MGPRRVAAASAEPDRHHVGRAGDGTLAKSHLADVEGRIAVDGEDRGDTAHAAVVDHLGGAAGHHLLGRLEDQPYPPRKRSGGVEPGECQAGAEQRGGVNVVPTRVRDPVDAGPPRVGRRVLHRKRVEVGAERYPPPRPVGRPEVGDQPGRRKALERYAGGIELTRDQLGGVLLLPSQLGVRVNPSAQRDQRWGKVVNGGDQVRLTGHIGEATAIHHGDIGTSTGQIVLEHRM